mgnify:FL=1
MKVTEKKTRLPKHFSLYMFLVPGILLTVMFSYAAMPGLIIGFMDYNYFLGFKSPWVGLSNIIQIFTTPELNSAIVNTLILSIINLTVVFPLPIIFALMLNELRNGFFKRFTQTVSYLPYFLSTISIIGIATSTLGEYGIINDIKLLFNPNAERTLYLTIQNLFVPNIIALTIWQTLGWSSIIYLSTISGIDPTLYEAAAIDGASKFKQCIYVTLPGILPTVVLLFILQIGNLFKSNFDLIYGLQNPFINFEVISTVVYKQGITNGNYSISTAFGFIEGFISLILIFFANFISKKINDISII